MKQRDQGSKITRTLSKIHVSIKVSPSSITQNMKLHALSHMSSNTKYGLKTIGLLIYNINFRHFCRCALYVTLSDLFNTPHLRENKLKEH